MAIKGTLVSATWITRHPEVVRLDTRHRGPDESNLGGVYS